MPYFLVQLLAYEEMKGKGEFKMNFKMMEMDEKYP